MDAYTLSLRHISADDHDRVGGKAFALATLKRAGFNVPDAFCLTTAALSAVVARLGLLEELEGGEAAGASPADHAAQMQALIRSAAIPDDVLAALSDAYQGLGEGPVVVRSSAPQEDQADSSFAGQYDTYLNLTSLAELVQGVRSCWASLWNERAVAYRRRRLGALDAPAMGVLVQRLVPAEVSGVLFTLNPLSGREEEMVIEAAWGLGEAIVSGRVTPDHYVVDAWRELVLERRPASQRVKAVPGAVSGVEEAAVPAGDRERAVLADTDLLRLSQLGLRIQEEYGCPQDIEWALHDGQIHVLQSRPLTAISFSADIGQWTSANFREIMPGLVNPLSFSINLQYEWGQALDEFFTRMKMQPDNKPVLWGRTFFGRAYWNVSEVKRRASLIPGFRERAFDSTVGLAPAYTGDGRVTPITPRTVVRALPILFSLNSLYATIWKEADACRRAFQDEEKRLLAVAPGWLSEGDLASQTRRVLDLHFRTNRMALLVSFLSTQAEDDFHVLVETLNRGAPASEQVAMGDLLTGLGNVRTARPLLDLWRLAQRALLDAPVAAAIRAQPTAALLAHLQTFPEGVSFSIELHEYLQRYAHMASADEDLTARRWADDPAFVLSTLKGFVEGGKEQSTEVMLNRQQAARRRARERARRLMEQNWANRLLPFRKRTFFGQLRLIRRYCWWREEMRDVLSRAHYQCHRFLTELGRRWAADGRTDDPLALFYLTREQFLAVLSGQQSFSHAAGWIRRNRRAIACYRNFQPPETIGQGATSDGPARAAAREGQHVGVACSPGVAIGPARVICDLAEAGRLRAGDILIAPYTNPGWTPLFSLAAAVIMEEGGLLSHGAVLARECGVPAVLRVRDATRLFHDGQLLRVDGGRGVVEPVRA